MGTNRSEGKALSETKAHDGDEGPRSVRENSVLPLCLILSPQIFACEKYPMPNKNHSTAPKSGIPEHIFLQTCIIFAFSIGPIGTSLMLVDANLTQIF